MFAALKRRLFNGGPDKDWMKEHAPTGYTFDMWKLERFAYQPLFVCDQWMQGQRMHSMIEPYVQFRGTAFTAHSNWIMWKKKQKEEHSPYQCEWDQRRRVGSGENCI